MGLIQNVLNLFTPLSPLAERADPTITVGQYAAMLNPWDFTIANYNGNIYPAGGLNTSIPGSKQEEIDQSFEGFVRQAYRANGVVFACMAAHMRLFSEGRFQFQRLTDGRPGDLFGTPALELLEHPWRNGTTGDLLARMIQDADLAGNFFAALRNGRIKRMRPDWVTIVLGSEQAPNATSIDLDADVLGYIYWPGGRRAGNRPVPLHADEVCHFAPIPDPIANFRGMSWLTPLVREVMADSAATAHKLTFFENGATPNLVIKRPDSPDKAAFELWKEMMEEGHKGLANAYRTLYMTAGADATVVGGNMQQLDFKVVQGAGETRIAAAAGVPPIIVGLSEGLSAATYSNYGQARRAFADLWAYPNWRNAAGSLQTLVPAPKATRLWVDARDVPFLAEDMKDAANIQSVNALTIKALIDTGFKADAAIQAVENGDMGFLTGQHTGLFSVQLQAPGSTKMPAGETAGDLPVGDAKGPSTAKVSPAAAKQLPAGDKKPAPAPARAYNPSELRIPSGPGGGQWTSGGAGAPVATGSTGLTAEDVHAAMEAGTVAQYTNAAGEWDPARVAAVHDPAIAKVLAGVEKPADGQPVLYMTGGGYGSGKSTLLDKYPEVVGFPTGKGAGRADPDALKKEIPEYEPLANAGDPMAASFVHEESSHIAKTAVTQGISSGYSMVYDTSGDTSPDKLASKVASFRKEGAKTVVAAYAYPGSIAEGQRRADSRAASSHGTRRFVPPALLAENHRLVSEVWQASAKNGVFDDLSLWSTAGALGSTPSLIARAKGGKTEVFDPVLWANFKEVK